MFTNSVGGGMAAAGTYFPHDEFYDTSTRDIITDLASIALPDAVVACETPALFEYYAGRAGRQDLTFVSLSDKASVAGLKANDFIVIDRGRRYFSNTSYVDYLENSAEPLTDIVIMGNTSARIYQLDDSSLAGIQGIAKQ
jgi:hypothetical protein